jgi:AbrB family looped-hinge helix DNA binding protein
MGKCKERFMPHFEAKMSSKGQVTVPAEVREFFALKEGDRVDFYIDQRTRSVRILARNAKLTDLFGLLAHSDRSKRPVSQNDIENAITEHVTEKHERISRQWNEWREFQDWKKSRAAE